MFMLVSGVAFCVAWLIIVVIFAASDDEPAIGLGYLVYGLPIAQAVTFTVYRSNRGKRIIGSAILTVMAAILAIAFLTNSGSFMLMFAVITAFNFVLYLFYEKLQSIVNSPEPYEQN